MRAVDWLLVSMAIAAIGIGLLANLGMCQTISGTGGPSNPERCIPMFPGPAVVGLGIAAVAAGALTFRILRRPRPRNA